MADLIPGLNLNIDFGAMGSQVVNMLFYGSLFLIVIAIIIWYIWKKREDKTFVIPVTLLKLRVDGSHKENPNLLGGVKQNKVGVKDFEVKIPGQWKKHKLGYIPDFSKAGADDRICFVQQGDGTLWQQCEKKLVTYKDVVNVITDDKGVQTEETVRYKLLIEPIPTDVKTATINNIHAVRNMLDRNKVTVYAIGVIAFVIMAIVQIAFLYFTTKGH